MIIRNIILRYLELVFAVAIRQLSIERLACHLDRPYDFRYMLLVSNLVFQQLLTRTSSKVVTIRYVVVAISLFIIITGDLV